MRLVLAPLVADAEGLRPDVPAWTRWGQASDAWESSGQMLLLVEDDDREIDVWLAGRPDAAAWDVPREAERIVAAVRAQRPVIRMLKRPDGTIRERPEPLSREKRGAEWHEWRALRREVVAPIVAQRRADEAARAALRGRGRVPSWLLPLGAALLGRALGMPSEIALGVVLAADPFTASDGTEVHGRTTPTGGLTYAVHQLLTAGAATGRLEIRSNTLNYVAGTGPVATLDDGTPIGEQYAQAYLISRWGYLLAMADYSSTANAYYMDATGGGAGRLRKVVAGSATLLASSVLGGGDDTYRLEVLDDGAGGWDLDIYKGGVLDVSGNDSALTSGVGGIGAQSATFDRDDFEWGDFSTAGGQPMMRRLGLSRFCRPVEIGRSGVEVF